MLKNSKELKQCCKEERTNIPAQPFERLIRVKTGTVYFDCLHFLSYWLTFCKINTETVKT